MNNILIISLVAVGYTPTVVQLENIVVTSTPIVDEQAKMPVAIGAVGEDDIQLGRMQIGLDESLSTIPGLFFQNRYNFAQDQRISIRGFGSRASFGIRGIKIYADRIPQTLPDGQSSVDTIDLGSAQRIEVIRGPFSSVFGSSAGGVINITTEDGPEIPFLSGRLNTGSFGFLRTQIKTGGQSGKLNYLLHASDTDFDGYRDHAKVRSTLLNSKFRYQLDGSSNFVVVINAVNAPKADDPGALNFSEVTIDPEQAAPRNSLFDAGEKLDQQSLGLTYDSEINPTNKFTLRNYYVLRNFSNKLPFSINSNGQGGSVALNRFFAGLGGSYTNSTDLFSRGNSLVLGVDINLQQDLRKRFANNQGTLGEETTNQDEDVTSYGLYIQDSFLWTDDFKLTWGARYDTVRYEINDHTGGEGSGSAVFSEISSTIGFVWAINKFANFYGNISDSFDTPTTTELANPVASSGFNSNLVPQTATNYEIGLKGLLPGSVRYEVALFHIDVQDELIRYELAGSGQSFFENAGSSIHDGLETALTINLSSGLSSTLTYTYSDFTFDKFTDNDGNKFDKNKLPGVPDNNFHLVLDYVQNNGFYASWDFLYADDFYADNANSVKTDSYKVSNVRAGITWLGNQWELSPYVGVNNIFAAEYFDNVRLNANFGRYFEPAPGRNYYGGIEVLYNFN